jgi:GxxExxY protein
MADAMKNGDDAGSSQMNENEIATIVVDSAFHIHNRLGPGLMESVYELILAKELQERGLRVERQKPISLTWKDIRFEEGFRADLIVEKKVIIEIKASEVTPPVAFRQLLTYLRLADMRLGLVVNFGCATIHKGIRRVVNGLEE